MRNILLMGQAGFPEMHLIIDHTGQKIFSFCIEFLRTYCASDTLFIDLFDTSVTYENIGLEDATFIYHVRISDQPIGHGRGMLTRIFNTPRIASLKILLFILLRPLIRSTKVMGTSLILNPASRTRYFISIWNA